jgi:membrane protease YdiL (CAAX protease family)
LNQPDETHAQTTKGRDRLGEALRRNRALVVAELALVALLMAAYQKGILPFSETPYLFLFAWLSLWLRRVGWRGVGLRRPERGWGRTLLLGTAAGVLIQLFGLLVFEPFVARLTGELPDVSQFRPLVGNVGLLLFLLVVSWTLAAFGEELNYRGYLLNRVADLAGGSWAGLAAGLVVSSTAFGLMHSYQGLSGMITTGTFGLLFGALYLWGGRNLWLPIIAHGVVDTIGFALIYLGRYPGL